MEKKKEKSEYGNWKVIIKKDKFNFIETYFRASNVRECIEAINTKKKQIDEIWEIVRIESPIMDWAVQVY